MNKYIDAEKLIAEIEKWSDGKLTLSHLFEIKEIIASLQQEQPEVDWEKELRNWMTKMSGKYALLITNDVKQLITDTAKHFYKL